MLLSDLLKLFSNQLNIDEVTFNTIVVNNNIKLNQILTLDKQEKKEKKEKQEKQEKKIVDSNTNTEKRSRGRPRKQCNIISSVNIIPEDVDFQIVEEIVYNNNEYFKTDNNLLLNSNCEVQGVLVDGLVIMK